MQDEVFSETSAFSEKVNDLKDQKRYRTVKTGQPQKVENNENKPNCQMKGRDKKYYSSPGSCSKGDAWYKILYLWYTRVNLICSLQAIEVYESSLPDSDHQTSYFRKISF